LKKGLSCVALYLHQVQGASLTAIEELQRAAQI
jgi:hypothetical protein